MIEMTAIALDRTFAVTVRRYQCPQTRRHAAVICAWLVTRSVAAAVLVGSFWLPALCAKGTGTADDRLADGFREPDISAWPHGVWPWKEAAITAERITADLVSMKAAGMGGALIVRAKSASDPSHSKSMNDERDELLTHAVREAARLGLELGVHFAPDGDGADESVVPLDESSRKLTWAAQRFQGGGNTIVANLVAPPADGGGYEDIAVLASPVPPPAAETLAPTPWRSSPPWDRGRSIDLTSSMNAKGRLEWQAPPGFWNVLRIGATHAVSAVNWGPNFPGDFKEQCGYDPTPYLPLAVGWADLDPVIGRRFVWDMRTTLAGAVHGRNALDAREVAEARRLRLAVSLSAGATRTPRLKSLDLAQAADIPLGAFRVDGEADTDAIACRWAGSAGRVHGKPITGARACVAWATGKSPASDDQTIKPRVNAALCAGVNRIYLPAESGRPPGKPRPVLLYLARCQHLLQSGLPVVDICQLDVDDGSGGLPRSFFAGYAADVCTAEILCGRLRIDDGELTLPEGLRYRALVMPPHGRITPQAMKTVVELARAGATVAITVRPTESPSLVGYPKCDEEVTALAKDLCGDAKPPGRGFVEVACGRGRVVLLAGHDDLPAAIGVRPALMIKAATEAAIRWTHRRTPDAEIYFVANMRPCAESISGTFRVANVACEIWDPDTGEMRPALGAASINGGIQIPLTLGPYQALFVVFRKSS